MRGEVCVLPIVLGGVVAASAYGGTLLGTESLTGTVFELDTSTGIVSAVAETFRTGSTFSPNGNASDRVNGRLYFTTIPPVGDSALHFFDAGGSTPIFAGMLQGRAPDGAFYNGDYYYIDSGTDDLRRVDLASDGTLIAETLAVNLVSNQYGWGFGDIEILDNGLLVVRGGRTDTNQQALFQYDLVSSSFVSDHLMIRALQIARGDDGVLYGVGVDGKLYSIDLATGQDTELLTIVGLQNNLTDLAQPTKKIGSVPTLGLLEMGLLAALMLATGSLLVHRRTTVESST